MSLNSSEKVLTILMAFTPHNKEMGNVELSQKLGINVSTVNRLLHVLVSFGLIQQDMRTRHYSLGRAAADLGRAIAQSMSSRLVSIAQPFMQDLSDEMKESVSLEVLKGEYSTIAIQALGPPPLSVSFAFGERMPIHVAAGAKAMLAFSSPDLINRLLNNKLKLFTPNTITDPDMFRKQLTEIRSQGVSFDRGEYNIEVHAVAAPIFDHTNQPVAAISLCSPANRIKAHIESGVISTIKKTAAKISSKLLYSDNENLA